MYPIYVININILDGCMMDRTLGKLAGFPSVDDFKE